MKNTVFLFLYIMCSVVSQAQPAQLYEQQLFIINEDTLRCRILTPLDFSPQKKYPLLVFLHGAGERGSDNEKQLTWGADLFLDSVNRVKHQAIVVFPQCPENEYWANIQRTGEKDSLGGFKPDTLAPIQKSLNLVIHFIDTLIAHGGIDRSRIYLGGLSMGGFGTFELLWRRPDLFAAAFPICGGGSPQKTRLYARKVPLWVFHGDADPVVPAGNSRLMVSALKANGAEVKYTEYPGVGHDSWKNAFAEPQLLNWVFGKKKEGKRREMSEVKRVGRK